MPEIEIRPARQEDLDRMLEIDHSFSTLYVFQMDISQETNTIGINFRNVKLPRAAAVNYPRSESQLINSWEKATSIFVAWINGEVAAYICLEEKPESKIVRVGDLVVIKEKRRMGIGHSLLLASEEWAARRKNTLILMEMQAKNYPAISLARKLGYQFCGYQDNYFPTHEMALFFCKHVR